MKLIILDIKRTVPNLNSHTLPDYRSRRIFTPEGMYNSMPMIGSDCGSVVCKGLRPFEVFHPNDVSTQKGRTRPSHHRTFTKSRSGVLYVFSLVCVLTRTTDSRLRRRSRHPMFRTVQRAKMVSPLRREFFISDLSNSDLSGCQKSAPHCSNRPIYRPNFARGFFTCTFKSSAQNYVDVQCCVARNKRS